MVQKIRIYLIHVLYKSVNKTIIPNDPIKPPIICSTFLQCSRMKITCSKNIQKPPKIRFQAVPNLARF